MNVVFVCCESSSETNWTQQNWTEWDWIDGIRCHCSFSNTGQICDVKVLTAWDCVSSSSPSSDGSPPTCSSSWSTWLHSASCLLQVRTHITSTTWQPFWNPTQTMSLGTLAEQTEERSAELYEVKQEDHYQAEELVISCWLSPQLLWALCSITYLQLLMCSNLLIVSHHVSMSASSTKKLRCTIKFYGRDYNRAYVSKMKLDGWKQFDVFLDVLCLFLVEGVSPDWENMSTTKRLTKETDTQVQFVFWQF